MAIRVVPLETFHEVNEFNCGSSELNIYLQTTARQHQRKHISKSYVLINDDTPTTVMGFYTLSVRRMVAKEDLPLEYSRKMPRDVPGFSLARLAVRDDLKGQKYGEYLLYHAMDRAERVSDEIGGYALFVDAKNDHAADFYKKYGFVPFPDQPLVLCMPFANMMR